MLRSDEEIQVQAPQRGARWNSGKHGSFFTTSGYLARVKLQATEEQFTPRTRRRWTSCEVVSCLCDATRVLDTYISCENLAAIVLCGR